jgi:transcriptional regulator with XRE-family HTH domain
MGQKKRTQPEKLKIKLKTIRVKMEVSQQKMVELLSYYAPNEVIVPGYISDFEAGKREPSLIVLLAYSKLTGVSSYPKDTSLSEIARHTEMMEYTKDNPWPKP